MQKFSSLSPRNQDLNVEKTRGVHLLLDVENTQYWLGYLRTRTAWNWHPCCSRWWYQQHICLLESPNMKQSKEEITQKDNSRPSIRHAVLEEFVTSTCLCMRTDRTLPKIFIDLIATWLWPLPELLACHNLLLDYVDLLQFHLWPERLYVFPSEVWFKWISLNQVLRKEHRTGKVFCVILFEDILDYLKVFQIIKIDTVVYWGGSIDIDI